VLLGDGGYLFELERRGYVEAGIYTPEVALEHPEALLQLHREFARAGSDILQALTFYGTEDKLSHKVAQTNRAAVQLAREAAGPDRWVAGGLSPTPSFRQGASPERVLSLMRRHADVQAEAGVDLLVGETFLWLAEARLALQAMRATGLPALVTLNVGPDGSRDGFAPEECARQLRDEGALAVGVNCSYGPVQALNTMASATICQPIAYAGDGPFESWPEFPLNLESRQLGRQAMAEFATRAQAQGVRWIGGCCGVAPYHIRAMAEALGRTPEGSCKSPDLSRHIIPEVRLRAQQQLSSRPQLLDGEVRVELPVPIKEGRRNGVQSPELGHAAGVSAAVAQDETVRDPGQPLQAHVSQ
jgi:betaine-homocysteine S-methyltransferase